MTDYRTVIPLPVVPSARVVVEQGADAEVVSAELVDDPSPAPVPGAWMAERRARLEARPPVLPRYLTQGGEFRQGAAFTARYVVGEAAFYGVRAPVYAVRLWSRAPRGTVRLVATWGRWALDAEGRALMAVEATGRNTGAYLQLKAAHDRTVKTRTRRSLVVAVPVGALVTLAALLLPGAGLVCVAAGVLALLGLAGAEPDRPIVHRYVAVRVQRRLDSPEVENALKAIGIKGKADWVAPIAVDGPGWRAELDLPGAHQADEVLEARAGLAAAMRRPLGCVWPEGDRDAHPGRLVLWVAREDPAKGARRIWPLMKTGQADLFAEIPYGYDPRGRLVTLRLMYSNALIGGVMGSGKTSAVLVIALAAALDPTAELWIYEMKGSGDLDALKPVSHRYVSGDDDEHCEAAYRALLALEKEMKRRKAIIKDLPAVDVPDGRKTTKQLAARRDLGLHPLVAIFDECHTLFEHPEYRDQAAEVAARLVKKARAYGIILVLTTQRPDAKSIPRGVSDNAITRLLLAVTGHVPNDLIAGTGAYKRGVRGTMFDPERDAGTAWIVRGLNARIARAAFIRQDEAVDIVRRAHALRVAAGTVTGQAAGEDVQDAEDATIVDHLTAVWPAGEDTAHSARLVEALAVFRPDLYAPWLDQDQAARSTTLAAALRPFGVRTRQVNKRGAGGSAKGLRLDDLTVPTGTDEDLEGSPHPETGFAPGIAESPL
ncbi:FtsK/SpoIIIE domain-containing protein [Actinocorallia aurea]